MITGSSCFRHQLANPFPSGRPTSSEVAAQSSLVRQQQALDMIAVFAEKLCKDIPLTGGGRSLELSGKAKAELSGIIKKIANLGVEGAAKYQTSEYRGLLQKDLAKAIKESTNCRLEVWKDLKDKLLGVAAPPPPPSPYDTATRVANA